MTRVLKEKRWDACIGSRVCVSFCVFECCVPSKLSLPSPLVFVVETAERVCFAINLPGRLCLCVCVCMSVCMSVCARVCLSALCSLVIRSFKSASIDELVEAFKVM